jgi:hypothetical protein
LYKWLYMKLCSFENMGRSPSLWDGTCYCVSHIYQRSLRPKRLLASP